MKNQHHLPKIAQHIYNLNPIMASVMPAQKNLVDQVENFKLPPFCKNYPNMWFIQIEALFQSKRIISDSTRFHKLLEALDTYTILEVADVLWCPPELDRYNHLKSAIIQRCTDSTDCIIHKALIDLTLGDKMPSQLLRLMLSLAGGRVLEDDLRVRWLALLPNSIRRCLKVVCKSNSLEEQMQVADELFQNGYAPFAGDRQQHSSVISMLPTQTKISDNSESELIKINKELIICIKELTVSNKKIIKFNKDPNNQRKSTN